MAGGYTHLNAPHDTKRDDLPKGAAQEGKLSPLQGGNKDALTPADLTCHPPPPSTPLLRDLISVFVVTFDPKEGNLLEWSVPKGVALDGVEFRALISGAHTITSDFIYFRQGDYYGAACYEKLETGCEGVRGGVRMKSVGVIAAHYHSLHHHLPHLASLVRSVLRLPGEYSVLQEYFTARRAPTPPPSSWHGPPRVTGDAPPSPGTPVTPSPAPLPLLQGTTPTANTATATTTAGPHHLLQGLGEQVMALWRASLLCKRILLLSEPPIGRRCVWVHWVSLLGAHTTPGLPSALLRPLFYVSLADLDLLADQHAYVACTTEKIFEEKTSIYDFYVEGRDVRVSKKLAWTRKVTAEDHLRLNALLTRRDLTQGDFRAFFEALNDGIFSALYRACGVGGSGVIAAEEMAAMGLNVRDDCMFVRELAATHGFDVTVRGDVCACCPCPSVCVS